MKKHLSMLMLIAAMVLPWVSSAQDCTQNVPYTQGFEGVTGTTYSTAGSLPACWNGYSNGTTATYTPHVVTGTGSYSYQYSGINSLIMTSGSSTYGDVKYVLLPPLNESLDLLQLSFWMCTESSTNGVLTVGYVTSNDTSTFTAIQSYPASSATYHGANNGVIPDKGVVIELPLSNVPSTATRLAFKWVYTTSFYSCCIDDVYIDYIPTCPRPTGLVVNPTGDGATISWNPGGTEAEWELLVGNSNYYYPTDTFYTVTGLSSNTNYDVAVRAICGSGDTSWALLGEFRTLCGYLDSLPYFENFDGVTGASSTSVSVNNLPPCWMHHNVGTNTSYSGYPIVYTSSSYARSGSQAMRFYNYITAGSYADQYGIMPMTDSMLYPVNTLMVDFWMRANTTTYNSYCVVGVMSDPTDASTFVPVETVYTNSSTTYAHHQVFLGSYNGPHGCVAFKFPQPTSGYNYGYVDDVTLDLMPACPNVARLEVDHATPDSIVVSWVPNGSESSWLVTIGNTSYVSSDTIYAFDNLTPSTVYTISVSALCDNGDTSAAVSITANTECTYATLPIIENFDGVTGSTVTSSMANVLPPCWDYYNDGTRTNYQGCPYVYNSTTYSHSGANCIRFYSYNSSGDSSQYLILPAVDPDEYEISGLQLTFWLRGNSTSSNYFNNVIVGVMTSSTVESSFIPYDTILSSTTTYTYHEVNFNHYTGPHGRVTLMFPKPASSSQYEYGYLDDLTLGPIPTCLMVENLTSEYSASDTIIISWQPAGSESQWEVTYNTVSTIVTDTFFIADNLNPNTEYTFTVRAVCSIDDTSYPASVTARTDCGPLTTLPYFESFEGLPAGSSTDAVYGVPCYGRLDNAGTNHFGYIGSPTSWPTGAHTGTGFLYYYLPLTETTHADWIITILPQIDVTLYPLNTLQVSFWVKMNSATTSANIQVGVISNTNDPTTFIPLDTVHVAGDVYELKEAYLSNYVDTVNATHIALRFTRNTETNYFFIDDFTIEEIPDCPPVSGITATTITSDSLYVTWSENGEATSWNVEYGPSGFTAGTGTPDIATSVPFAIGGLTANTAYDVYITPVCTSGTSATRMATFHTGCGPTPVPFTESFDTWSSTAADPLPNCWDKHTNYSTNYPYASTSYYHSGTKAMYMYSTGTTYSYMVLPQFDLPIDSTMVSFWLYKTNTSYAHKLLVGVMTNPADVTTFVQVAEVVPSALSTWEQFEVPLATYNGTGNRIAIMSPGTEYSYPYLDDLEVTRISGCLRVNDLRATTVLLDSATIVWTDGVNTGWNVEYDTVNFTPGTTHTPIHVTDTMIVLGGLDSGTVYYVYVYPDCDSGSAARGITFTTLAAAPASVPYFCDFEASGVNGWDLINAGQNNYWIVGNATNNGGTRSMYVTDNGTANSYSGAASYSFAVRTFNLAAGNYICSYDWKCQGESSFDFLRVALVPAGTNIEAGAYCGFDNASAMPAGSIALDGAYRMNLQSSWTNHSEEFTLATAGTYKLVFMWRNDGSVYNLPPAAIDNVQLMLNTCPRPQNITITNLTQTSADFSWTEVGSATTWEYQLGTAASVVVIDTFCSITGLTSNTPYTFRVRSICSGGDTGAWTSYNFRTPCGYVNLPYIEDFENETTGSNSTGSAFVNCWTRLNNGTSYGGYPYVSSSSSYNHTTGGSKGLYWYNTTTTGTYGDYLCAVLPPVDPSVGVDSLQLSFWAKASSASYTPTFQIGVMTDPNNITSFVGVDTVTVTSGTNWMLIEVPLVTYTGTGQYVAVKVDRSSSWTAYTDDFILEYVPTCLIPHNVTSTAASTTSITVDWTDMSPASEWEIRYGRTAATATTVTAYSHPYTVTGLDTLTSYNFEVRAVCTVGDTSRWSTAVVLGTEICDDAMAVTTGPNTGTGYYTPLNNFYNYTLTETIIDSAELVGVGDIEAIAYSYAYSSPSTEKVDVTIWLQPTTKTVFSSSSDIDLLDTTIAVQVYHGNLNCSQGWNYFRFTNPYTWDGHSNLMVIVDDNSGEYDGSSYTFNTSACNGYKTIYWYSDSYNPDPTSSSFSGTKSYAEYRATMKLISCGGGCPSPAISSMVVDYGNATITVVGNNIGYELTYGTDPSNLGNAMTSTDGTFTITGLQPLTQYFVAITQQCDSGLVSAPTMRNFTTDSLPCFEPTDLAVANTTFSSTELSWVSNGNATSWVVSITAAGVTTYDTVSTNPYTITGLYADQEYSVMVLAICGNGTLESGWSQPTTFTTDVCTPVTGVTVNDVTASSAKVSWNPISGTRGYKVYYGDPGFPDQEAIGTADVNATTTEYTITGLTASTVYEVFVLNRCSETLYSNITANDRVQFTTGNNGIYDVESGTLTLFPNPASEQVTLTVTGFEGEVMVEIVDMNGRASGKWKVQNGELKIDVSELAQGAYFVRVTGDSQTAVRKLIVK